MGRRTIYAMGAFALFALVSCGGDKEPKEEKAEKECFYTYNSGSTVMEWTAFKFTDKTPVKGTFKTFHVEGKENSDDPKKLIESLKFHIETSSVETNDASRNEKITKLFFGTIATPDITGKVKSLSDNGKATIQLTMNKKTEDVNGEYTLEDGVFTFKATIDVLNWNAGKGIETLNEACKDLHKGPDGTSKLWSEVDLFFSTELMNDCD